MLRGNGASNFSFQKNFKDVTQCTLRRILDLRDQLIFYITECNNWLFCIVEYECHETNHGIICRSEQTLNVVIGCASITFC